MTNRSAKSGSGTLRDLEALARAGLVAPRDVRKLAAVARRYAIAVTPAMAALIEADRPGDPIARQFIPDARELEVASGESADPIGDRRHEKAPGVIHRYPDRVLLKLTHACPVYCRFCFRREVVGPGGPAPLAGDRLAEALAYVRSDPAIFEVILTGGDPLMLSVRRIEEVTQRLGEVAHVRVLRWHSRVPIVDPARVTGAMVAALTATRQTVYIGIHANHPRELGEAQRAAIRRLSEGGLHLVSQTVLLKGINDDADVLAELFRTFVALGIRPYYLHHADMAPGTAHFRTSIAAGQAIMRRLRGRLSGLALPTYVLDIPGGFGKVPVGPPYIDDDAQIVADPGGEIHAYPPTGRE